MNLNCFDFAYVDAILFFYMMKIMVVEYLHLYGYHFFLKLTEKYPYWNNRSIPFQKLLKLNYLYMNIVFSYTNLFGNCIFRKGCREMLMGRKRILESKGEGGRGKKGLAIQ